MPRPPTTLCLALLLAAPAAGCGERAAPPAQVAHGEATWSAVRDESLADGVLMDLRATAPCRARVRIVGVPEGAAAETTRQLAAGESLRLWVSVVQEPAPRPGAPVNTGEKDEGRTEPWVATLAYGWGDALGGKRVQVVGTRPGRGAALGTWRVLPPGPPRSLPFDTDLDLACVAVADGGSGLTLEGRERGSRVRGTLDAAAGDRVTLMRVVVRIERMGP